MPCVASQESVSLGARKEQRTKNSPPYLLSAASESLAPFATALSKEHRRRLRSQGRERDALPTR